ncbi:MAG: hypothetical protein EBU70_10225 [Actinobacteria bacterium]|nr:hypothetical protein [Actinomycetota bacterium]
MTGIARRPAALEVSMKTSTYVVPGSRNEGMRSRTAVATMGPGSGSPRPGPLPPKATLADTQATAATRTAHARRAEFMARV